MLAVIFFSSSASAPFGAAAQTPPSKEKTVNRINNPKTPQIPVGNPEISFIVSLPFSFYYSISRRILSLFSPLRIFIEFRIFFLLPIWEHNILHLMRIISRKKLREFWERHPDVRQPLQAWYDDTKRALWKNPSDIKSVYRNASFVGKDRVVFNLKGNAYRLVVAIQYEFGIVFIRFVGTHQEYDRIDVSTV
jgi:mRNA interferase HigB